MRQKYVMGNWKMHGSFSSISVLLHALTAEEKKSVAKLVVFPPYVYLQKTHDALKNTDIAYGAQNVYPAISGAYTGEIAGPMLKDLGCKYVMVGHSERRHIFGESDEIIARKFKHVKECGMIPVFCVGETAQERDDGRTEDVLLRQLMAVIKLSDDGFQESVIAYEPVWAIGTGNTALPEQIQKNHTFIRSCILKYESDIAAKISILYGGSVTPDIASNLASIDDVDGFLVGGASLNANSFLDIARCIN